MRLAKVKNLLIDTKALKPKGSALGIVDDTKIFIPLGNLIDLNTEKIRMNADIVQKGTIINSLNTRLSNTDFTAKAPKEIITKEEERLYVLTKEVNELKNELANLT